MLLCKCPRGRKCLPSAHRIEPLSQLRSKFLLPPFGHKDQLRAPECNQVERPRKEAVTRLDDFGEPRPSANCGGRLLAVLRECLLQCNQQRRSKCLTLHNCKNLREELEVARRLLDHS